MAAAVTYRLYSEVYGGGLSEAAFGFALPAASRHVRWLVGGAEPGDDELEGYLVAECRRCEDFNGRVHHWELMVR